MSGLENNPSKSYSADTLAQNPKRALSNALIIRTILSFMRPGEVLKLRRLSKAFEEVATSLLLSNGKIQEKLHIKFTWEGSTSQPEQGHHEHVYMGTLSNFVETTWATSRRFPVLNFSFENCCLETQDILDFFKNVGKHVKILSLNPSSSFPPGQSSLQILKSILFEWTTNLKHLNLISTPWPSTDPLIDQTNSEKEEKAGLLSSLETLTLKGQGSTCSFGVARDILKSSPNLRLILDPTLKYTEISVECGKFHLGPKFFQWEFERETNQRFSVFSKIRPQHFRELSLYFGKVGGYSTHSPWKKVGRRLNNIFLGGASTLEKIGRLPFLQTFQNLDPLPVMEKVTEVYFYQQYFTSRSRRGKMLLEGQILQEIFPALKTLRLHQLCQDTALNPLFQPFELYSHDGVTTLELVPSRFGSQFEKLDFIPKVVSLYPNITSFELEIDKLKNLPRILRDIWTHLKILEHLKLKISFVKDDSLGDKLPGEMDSAMTGIPVKLCHQLRRNLAVKGHQQREDVEHLREYPPILNLHQLKKFEFRCRSYVQNKEALFTPVSILYAFEPMFERQKLEASVGSVSQFFYHQGKGIYGIIHGSTEKKFLVVG